MSYEPRLLIKAENLEKHKDKFEKISYGIIPDEKQEVEKMEKP